MSNIEINKDEYQKLIEEEKLLYWIKKQKNYTEQTETPGTKKLSNYIQKQCIVDNFEPEMRLYGVDENYFETIDELLKYCRRNKCSTKCLTILDYYRNFYKYKDVIKKTTDEISLFYAISNENGYVWYGDELNMHGEDWEFTHGQIRSLYKPFRDHGIVFEDDIYARESEKNQHILHYCRQNNLFNMGKK